MRYLLILCVFASQAVVAQNKLVKKLQKDRSILEYALENGSLGEVSARGEVFIEKHRSEEALSAELYQIYKLKGVADFYNFQFDKYEITVKTLSQLYTKNNDVEALLALSDLLATTKSPRPLADLCNTIPESGLNHFDQEDLNLFKAEALSLQGYYKESNDILIQQEKWRKSLAENQEADSSSRYFNNQSDNFRRHKNNYAKLKNIQIENMLQQGNAQALIEINDLLDWYREFHNGSRVEKCKTYIGLSRFQEEILDRPDLVEKSLLEALKSAGNFPQSTQKVSCNFKLATLYLEKHDIINADHHIRQLQINASGLAGENEPAHIYYELAVALRFYEDGNINRAISKLQDLEKMISGIPENHPAKLDFLKQKADFSYGDSRITEYLNMLSSISQLKENVLGQETPEFKRCKLDEIIETRLFKGFSLGYENNIIELSNTLNAQLHSGGPVKARYFDLLSDYYFYTGSIDSAIIYSDSVVDLQSGQKAHALTRNYYHLKNVYLKALTGEIDQAYEFLNTKEDSVLLLTRNYSGEGLKTLLLLNKLYNVTEQRQKSLRLAAILKSLNKPVKGLHNLPEQIQANNALASIHKDAGNYLKAEKIAFESFSLLNDDISRGPFIFPLLSLNAELKLIQGDFDLADKDIQEAIQIAEKNFGHNSIQYAQSRLLQVKYFESIADYKNALEVIDEVQNILENSIGKENSFSSDVLVMKAGLLINTERKNPELISSLYLKALSIAGKVFSENSEHYNHVLIGYAEYLIKTDRYQEASQLLAESMESLGAAGEDKSMLKARLLLTNARLQYALRQYKPAEKYLNKALLIVNDLLVEGHPMVHACKGELARIYYMQGKPDLSLNLMEEIIPAYLNFIEELFPSMSFRQKSSYWKALKDEFEFYNFLILDKYGNEKPDQIGKVFNNVIATKAILLSSDKQIREQINFTQDSVLVDMFDQWVALKEELGSIYNLNKNEQAELAVNVSAMERDIESFEKAISMRSSSFSEKTFKEKATWKEIRNTLNKDESVIEMTRVRYFDHTFQDSAFYAALVLSAEKEYPEVVIIPNAKELENRYYRYHKNILTLDLKDEYSFDKFWSGLAKVTGSKNVVYFSPEGIYYQINPETFQLEDGSFLLEKQSFSLLTNSKDLVHEKPGKGQKRREMKHQEVQSFVLGGNPLYYETGSEGSVPQLPGAEKEVRDIGQVVLENGLTASVYTGEELTEEKVKMITQCKVLHFATHGFFQETIYKENYNPLTSPLLNSGILFYGGGEILDKNQNINSRNGILTAYEASTLNLIETDLVVLSACETGRGEIMNGEGVFGLQRAFLQAGADAVIMSLFKVNDEVTRKFMLYFYKHYLASGDTRKAFTNAKIQIKKEFPSPINWGSFLLIENSPKSENQFGLN